MGREGYRPPPEAAARFNFLHGGISGWCGWVTSAQPIKRGPWGLALHL